MMFFGDKIPGFFNPEPNGFCTSDGSLSRAGRVVKIDCFEGETLRLL